MIMCRILNPNCSVIEPLFPLGFLVLANLLRFVRRYVLWTTGVAIIPLYNTNGQEQKVP